MHNKDFNKYKKLRKIGIASLIFLGSLAACNQDTKDNKNTSVTSKIEEETTSTAKQHKNTTVRDDKDDIVINAEDKANILLNQKDKIEKLPQDGLFIMDEDKNEILAVDNTILKDIDSLMIPKDTKVMQTPILDNVDGIDKVIFESDDDIKIEKAFAGSPIKRIILPKNLKHIGPNTFFLATNLETLRLPDSVESIATNAFCNTTALKSIYLDKSLDSIDELAFANSDLEDIYLDKDFDATKIKSNAFLDVDGSKIKVHVEKGSKSDKNFDEFFSEKVEKIIENDVENAYYNKVLAQNKNKDKKEEQGFRDTTFNILNEDSKRISVAESEKEGIDE